MFRAMYSIQQGALSLGQLTAYSVLSNPLKLTPRIRNNYIKYYTYLRNGFLTQIRKFEKYDLNSLFPQNEYILLL